jgi:hypothetical protein
VHHRADVWGASIVRLIDVVTVLGTAAVLSACSSAAVNPSISQPKFLDGGVPGIRSETCPKPPPPGNVTVASASISFAGPLVMGKAAHYKLPVIAYGSNGYPVTGTFANPIALTVKEVGPARPQITLSCDTIYSSSQVPKLTFGGEGDVVTITTSAKGASPLSVTFTTTLPKEQFLARPTGQASCCADIPSGLAAVDARGNIWTSLGWAVHSYSPVVGKITTSGDLTKFRGGLG